MTEPARVRSRPSAPKVTTPALKYGPTPVFGGCEAHDCESDARTTCATCGGHLCLRHAPHDRHI